MRYDVHFCSAMAMSNDGKMPGDEIATLDEFYQYYRYVGTFEAATLDELAGKLQNGGGGLGDKTMQKYVIRAVQHTSLSIGDIAIERDTGRVWFAALGPWRQIKLK
jgi:hypothetical protein